MKELRPYQVDACKYLYDRYSKGHSGAFLFMQMRLGKTLCVLRFLSKVIFSKNPEAKVLVVGPVKALLDWGLEWFEEFGVFPKVAIGKTSKKILRDKNLPKILLSSYSLCVRKDLLKYDWDVVVLDELYLLSKPSSDRSRYFYRNRKPYPCFTIGLTGSFRSEDEQDVVSQWLCVEETFLDVSLPWEFFVKYSSMSYSGKPIISKEVKEAMLEEIKSSAFVLTRDAVGVGGGKEYHRLVCPADSRVYELYSKAMVNPSDPMTKFTRLWMISSGVVPKEKACISAHKFIAVAKHIRENNVPLAVVFCMFISEIAKAIETFRNLGFKCEGLTGASSLEEQARIISCMKNGEVEIVVVQVVAFKMGVDLSASDYFYYATNPLSGDARVQSEDRGITGAKTRKIYIFDCITPFLVDGLWAEKIRDKNLNALKAMKICLTESKNLDLLYCHEGEI